MSVFSVRAQLQVTTPTQPCLFRRTLNKNITAAALTVFGTCDRNDHGLISIEFQVLDLQTRARLVTIILGTATQTASTVTAIVDLETALFPVVKVNVLETTLSREWQYVGRPPSIDSAVYQFPTTLSDSDVLNITRPAKKPRSDGEGSSGKQDAHVLFAGQQHRPLMIQLLQCLEVGNAETELQPLLQLTFPFQYRSHQDYDNFYFFFAWKFSQQGAVWALHTQPRILRVGLAQDPDVLEISSMSASDVVLWRHALALRKALAVALHTEKVHKPSFRHDWDEDESSCWAL